MKLWGNWGLGVTVFLVLFVIANVVFLIVVSSENFDMVEDNYYDKEIKYQEQIDKKDRADHLADPMKIRISDINTLEFDYPDDFKIRGISGKILFYRPSDRAMDFELEITPDTSFKQLFDYSEIRRGIWVLKINWIGNDSTYYHEEEIIL